MADTAKNQNTVLSKPGQEEMFREWYATAAKNLGLNKNPDDPKHFYDYRGAWLGGVEVPSGEETHWPSKYKWDDHPNRFIKVKDGSMYDTKYEKKVVP
ncbi:hypothetical protein M0Q28_06750 [Patescibacteria group bacterium]|nr:hypothetical protein [Patescibacteria group bacterium]